MGIELATYIQNLFPKWPHFFDFKKEGAAHIRQLKQTLLNSFPQKDFRSLTGMVTGQTVLAGVSLGDFLFDNNHYRSNNSDNITQQNDGDVLMDASGDWFEISLAGDIYHLDTFTEDTLLTWLDFRGTMEATTGMASWVELGYRFGTIMEPIALQKIYLPHSGIRNLTGFKKTLVTRLRIDPAEILAELGDYDDTAEFGLFIRAETDGGLFQMVDVYVTAREALA